MARNSNSGSKKSTSSQKNLLLSKTTQ